LRDLCRQTHTFYRDADTKGVQRRQFRPRHFPTLAMRPQEAVRCLVRNDVDYLPIDELFGRIATTLWVVYPPGIATIVPGERLDERAQPMIDYLKVFARGSNLFPGFENEVQGIYREKQPDGSTRMFTYVTR
jgi:ornithine decarboxylase